MPPSSFALQLVVSTLLSSTTLLLDMFVLTAFFLAIFGTMCVQLFGGQLQGRCGHPDFSRAVTDDMGFVQVSAAGVVQPSLASAMWSLMTWDLCG